MLPEEAIKCLKTRLKVAEYVDSKYCDSVDLEAIVLAIDALNRQTPMTITRFIRNRSKEVIGMGMCPSCGDIVTEHSSYCHKCGQRLDWEE